ncbi:MULTISPECIES: GH25 family lysozyme [Lactobacillus]|uniref:Lysozyme n=1 Tax=Lactobacillus xujianguonis TaxID=2495899 RepID=A0A437SXX7_9LACO|nr:MULTISPECIES: GH25 family lysozyme [Lactobacillus]RVU71766.1 lysin [Lactobacillus xujianguonis]
MPRQYGVDVASFNPTSLSSYHVAGAKFVIVKLTEGTGYFNPKATMQIKSAHAHHMFVHAYHFANFGASVKQAKAEAKWFVSRAKAVNISKKRYLWLDWETGDGNSVVAGKGPSTRAILAFMKVCDQAGYHVGLYSGASLMRNNIHSKQITDKYGTCLWIASYATMGRIDEPNFNNFPSMDGIAIWQFTDNWHGLGVDGNISLIDLHAAKTSVKTSKSTKSEPKKSVNHEKSALTGIIYVPVINNDPNWKVRLLDSKGHYQKYIKTNTSWKVWAEKTIKGMKCYKIGTDQQWIPAKFCKVK